MYLELKYQKILEKIAFIFINFDLIIANKIFKHFFFFFFFAKVNFYCSPFLRDQSKCGRI
jgi:hypothetical protein